jgi:hypothetical protein
VALAPSCLAQRTWPGRARSAGHSGLCQSTALPDRGLWRREKSDGTRNAHPSLKDLDAGYLKFHTDFRRVYSTLLDGWLGCDSKLVLGAKWDAIKELQPRA